MQQKTRTEILIDGVWFWGQLCDWETEGHERWAIVSARIGPGETYIGKVPESHVREVSPSPPAIPQPRHAGGATPLSVPSPQDEPHPVDGRQSVVEATTATT